MTPLTPETGMSINGAPPATGRATPALGALDKSFDVIEPANPEPCPRDCTEDQLS